MIGVTCIDVIFRIFGTALKGSYDVIRLTSIVILTTGLAYTTAVKGHVAIEYFFQKFSTRVRIVIDTVIRFIGIVLFSLLGVQSIIYGNSLLRAGEVTATLKIPVFWVPYTMAFSFFVLSLIILNNLLHPGKETIKP
jgi:TRAP-type C4-dicarboxylate transport system permease small subunit